MENRWDAGSMWRTSLMPTFNFKLSRTKTPLSSSLTDLPFPPAVRTPCLLLCPLLDCSVQSVAAVGNTDYCRERVKTESDLEAVK